MPVDARHRSDKGGALASVAKDGQDYANLISRKQARDRVQYLNGKMATDPPSNQSRQEREAELRRAQEDAEAANARFEDYRAGVSNE